MVGDNAVIGANAVVVKDVPERSVVAGIPARVIKADIDVATFLAHERDPVGAGERRPPSAL